MRFLSSSGESEDPLFRDVKPADPKAIPPDEGDAGRPLVKEPTEQHGSGTGKNL